MLPLHSSAIDVTDGCVAFMGPKRAGKSTTVAALAARGHQVIADDVCCLQLDEKDDLQAWSGINRLRLWEDAMTALGYNGPEIEREKHGKNKYFVPARPIHNPAEPRRMRRIYLLLFSPDDQVPTLARLQGAEVVEVLMQNVYRLSLAEHMGFGPAAFAACAAVAKNVPVFRFSRPIGFELLHESIEFLEDHLRCAG
jgi:hypothetical protein